MLPLAIASALCLFSWTAQADPSSYAQNSICANDQFMRYYRQDFGLWTQPDGKAYWWQSGSMLSTLAKLCQVNKDPLTHYGYVWDTTLRNGPSQNIYGEPGFISDYYDDDGWWALGWIDVYDLTGDRKYLDEAVTIFRDMKAGYNTTPCNGGLWWNKAHDAVVAIANELYISVAASLANRIGSDAGTYLNDAIGAWKWFEGTGMINSDNLINDGIDLSTCKNNGQPVYTYNQGVILGGLVEIAKATGDNSYLDVAARIADAATRTNGPLTDANGIFVEQCDRNQSCGGGDGIQFKGIFVRNLAKLQLARRSDQWKNFLEVNAKSIWANDLVVENGGCILGQYWAGPVNRNTFGASSQSIGLDCITGALAVIQ